MGIVESVGIVSRHISRGQEALQTLRMSQEGNSLDYRHRLLHFPGRSLTCEPLGQMC